MCYTSGTTGNPKGVVYSHRSTFLHSMGVADRRRARALASATSSCRSCRCSTPTPGACPRRPCWRARRSSCPGPDLTPPAHRRADRVDERVTVAAGVPTIWMGVLPMLDGRDLSSLRDDPAAAARPCRRSLSEAYREQIGLPDPAGLGHDRDEPDRDSVCQRSEPLRRRSTRTSRPTCAPGGGIAVPLRRAADRRRRHRRGAAVGRRGDRRAAGRGPVDRAASTTTTTRGGDAFTDDGWLRTGDVATIDRDGYIRLVDRTKDLIKSGGEWISSVELENEIMAHPKVAEAAVIGVPTRSGCERPLACVVRQAGRGADGRRGASSTSPRGWRSGGCPTTSSSSTRCRRPASASSRRRPSASKFAGYQASV